MRPHGRVFVSGFKGGVGGHLNMKIVPMSVGWVTPPPEHEKHAVLRVFRVMEGGVYL